MATETNVVLIIGTGEETARVLEAAGQEGWSAQHIESLDQLPPREQVDPEIVVLTSSVDWPNLDEEHLHALGKRVLWMVPDEAWDNLKNDGLASVVGANASVREIHYRLVEAVKELNRQLLARLGLPQNLQGEAIWDMLPSTDWVTGLNNRMSYLQEVRKQISRSKRYRRPFCCLLVQIDNYQLLRTTLAPEVMEELLSDVAGWLEMCIRDADMLARLQNDTFGMVLPETDVANAQVVVERIQQYLQNFQFAHAMPEPLAFSIGVSAFDGEVASLDSLLDQAREDLHALPKAAEPS